MAINQEYDPLYEGRHEGDGSEVVSPADYDGAVMTGKGIIPNKAGNSADFLRRRSLELYVANLALEEPIRETRIVEE